MKGEIMRSGPLGDEEADAIIEQHLNTYFDGTVRNVAFKIDGFTQNMYGRISDSEGNKVNEEFYSTLKLTAPEIGIDGKPLGPAITSSFCGGEEIQFRLSKYENTALDYGLNPFTDGYDVFIDADFAKAVPFRRGVSMDGFIGADKKEMKNAIKAGFRATCDPYGDLELSIGGIKFGSGPVVLKRKSRKHRLNEHIDCYSFYSGISIKRNKKNRRINIKSN